MWASQHYKFTRPRYGSTLGPGRWARGPGGLGAKVGPDQQVVAGRRRLLQMTAQSGHVDDRVWTWSRHQQRLPGQPAGAVRERAHRRYLTQDARLREARRGVGGRHAASRRRTSAVLEGVTITDRSVVIDSVSTSARCSRWSRPGVERRHHPRPEYEAGRPATPSPSPHTVPSGGGPAGAGHRRPACSHGGVQHPLLAVGNERRHVAHDDRRSHGLPSEVEAAQQAS
jgi:hypothetical protein